MCTLIILRRPNHVWPLLVAANRDEMADRPSKAPARHWEDRHDVTAGLDVLAGGTWLGVNDQRVVAAVLNRIGTLGPAPGKRSRGELPLEALDHESAEAAMEALAHLEPNAYRTFNLVVADPDKAYWLANDGKTIAVHAVPEGLHMITAFDMNSENSPRMRHFLPLFRTSDEPDPDLDDWRAWQALLTSRDRDPGTGEKGTMMVETSTGFGTVSSSLIAIPARSRFEAKTRWLYCDDRPDMGDWAAVHL